MEGGADARKERRLVARALECSHAEVLRRHSGGGAVAQREEAGGR